MGRSEKELRMNLLVISHTEHYLKNGTVVGWGATVRELDQLASLFDQVTHIATLHPGSAPDSAIAYQSKKVRFCPVAPAGGRGWTTKLGVVPLLPSYARTIRRELKEADIVHIRCPANISMVALLLITFARTPRLRWVKYAGNWRPSQGEAWSYTLQRWWLNRGWHRGLTTVNGRWPDQPAHVRTFLNPCLTDEELTEAKSRPRNATLTTPIRLIMVGRLDTGKGVRRALAVLASLRRRQVPALLDLIGDGPERQKFESLAESLGVRAEVRFHGWLPRPSLGQHYGQAHFMLLPSSSSEGWPKVLSEAMAYGAVPVCSNISSIPQNLRDFGVGRTFAPDDVEGYAGAIEWYFEHPEIWAKESQACQQAAERFSYANYLNAVRRLLRLEPSVALSTANGVLQH